jgi:Tfp pilus assembly protein PilF
MTAALDRLAKLIGTPRDGALLRYSLGLEHLKAGDNERAVAAFREALARDPLYSAAWKSLGKTLEQSALGPEAARAYREGIEAAKKKGDRQAEKEMTVFLRRLEKRGPAG